MPMQNTSCYYGNSMRGVFHRGDMLELRPICCEELKVGDIIAFNHPGKGKSIVHRVIALCPEKGGVITQGDNTPCPDMPPVTQEMKPSLVVGFRRGSRKFRVRGGASGMMQFRLNRLVFHGRRFVVQTLHGLGIEAPLAGMRFCLPPLNRQFFRDHEMLFAGHWPVAVRVYGDSDWRMTSSWAACFFSPGWLQAHYPAWEGIGVKYRMRSPAGTVQ